MREYSTGAVTASSGSQQQTASDVRAMFNSIAGRYDLLNHVLSLNVDRLWWRRTAKAFAPVLEREDSSIADVCCGTGDMTRALLRLRPAAARPILAIDFAHQMLLRAAAKLDGGAVLAVEADALELPVASSSLDLVISAFGFRNLANYRAGLLEFSRVLRPGAQLGILDFSEPGGLLGPLYAFYFRRVLPRIGALLAANAGSYAYLPRSVQRFPPPQRMLDLMTECGFERVSWTPYTFGIAGLYRGLKA